jgi:hypothetical protein
MAMIQPSPDHWRERVLKIAAEVGVQVLPVAYRPYRMVGGGNVHGPYDAAILPPVDVVDVNGKFESVFKLNGKFYLSGYDTQEDPPLYFLCALPHPVQTVDEAREALKPQSVALSEQVGCRIERQGDIFAIESGFGDDDLIGMGAEMFDPITWVARAGHHWPPTSRIPIYGTAHTSYHIARLPNNLLLAKGWLLHMPSIIGDERRRDHCDRKLGEADTWWWLTRNTVPLQAAAEPEKATS